MSNTKKWLIKIGMTFELFSKGMLYIAGLMLVFAGASFVLNIGNAENMRPQVLMLYWIFSICAMAITTSSWLTLKKNKLAMMNLFNRVKPFAVGLVMIAVMTFFNLAIWSVGCISVDLLQNIYYTLDLNMFSGLLLLSPSGVLGFLSMTLLAPIGLSAFVLGKFNGKKFGLIDLGFVVAAFILSLTEYEIACYTMFAVAAAATVINFVLAAIRRVDYEIL